MLRVSAVLLLLALATEPAAAQFMGPGSRHTIPSATASYAASARNGTLVTLEGNIAGRYRGDYYIFRDDTGEVTLAIQSHIWRRQPVKPDTLVRVTGEVSRNLFGRHVEVRRLQVLR